jgi:hypothetical protein
MSDMDILMDRISETMREPFELAPQRKLTEAEEIADLVRRPTTSFPEAVELIEAYGRCCKSAGAVDANLIQFNRIAKVSI